MDYEVTMPIMTHGFSPDPIAFDKLRRALEDMILADRKFIADYYRRALDLPSEVTDDMIFEMVRRSGEEMADEDGE